MTTFLAVFGISSHEWSLCRNSFQRIGADSNYNQDLRVKSWGDAHIHDFTFAETEEIYNEVKIIY